MYAEYLKYTCPNDKQTNKGGELYLLQPSCKPRNILANQDYSSSSSQTKHLS